MEVTLLKELSIIWSLCHILILFILLYRSKYSQKKTFFLTCIFMGPLIVLNLSGVVFLGIERMGQIFVLTCTLPSLVFYYLISQDRKWRFLFTFCLADTAAYWVIIVKNILNWYFGMGKDVVIFAGRLALFPILEWVAVRFLRKPYLELQTAVPKGWGFFAVMSAFYYVLLIAAANFPVIIVKRPEDMPVMILILVLMPLTYLTIFASLYRQLLLYRKGQEERIWQEQKRQMEARLENQERIRRLKHDMKAHTITLSGLLASGEIEEAQSYMWNMVYEYDQETSRQNICGNAYLDSVFSHFAQRFEKIDAELEMDIQIGEEELPFMELCQIISNGLENSWDALQELPLRKRKASLEMRYSKEYLLIRIKNRCKTGFCVKKGDLPASSKPGPEHGFGLRTIQDAARKLEGEMICYTKEGYFLVDVMIKAGRENPDVIVFSERKKQVTNGSERGMMEAGNKAGAPSE